MVNAIIDGYAQLTIKLSRGDIAKLEEKKYLEGSVWRVVDGLLPLKIYVKDSGWRAEGIPPNSPYERKTHYEVDVPPAVVDALKTIGKSSCGLPTTALRFVYLDMEDAT